MAYFDRINSEGGINGRKVRLISLDDGFNPAKTLEQTRKLVELDQVLALFSPLGPGTLAIRKYTSQQRVPMLILGDGDSVWDDRNESPLSVAFIPAFEAEGRAFAQYLIQHLLSYVSASVDSVLEPAGLNNSAGIISTGFLKQPSDPAWRDDAQMNEYFAFMSRYYPAGNAADGYNAYGYLTAAAMVHVLRQCADDLSRENLLRQAQNFQNMELPLLLPGIKVDSRPNPARPMNQLQVLKFDGKRWVRVGEVLKP